MPNLNPIVTSDLISSGADLAHEVQVLSAYSPNFLNRFKPWFRNLLVFEEFHIEQGEAHPCAVAFLNCVHAWDLWIKSQESLGVAIDHGLTALSFRVVQSRNNRVFIDILVELDQPISRRNIILFQGEQIFELLEDWIVEDKFDSPLVRFANFHPLYEDANEGLVHWTHKVHPRLDNASRDDPPGRHYAYRTKITVDLAIPEPVSGNLGASVMYANVPANNDLGFTHVNQHYSTWTLQGAATQTSTSGSLSLDSSQSHWEASSQLPPSD